ncbi:MAG: glycosyltransferase family 39 protein [bacterium]|nr:glycosyltransferase family 39 protein [bacterium]
MHPTAPRNHVWITIAISGFCLSVLTGWIGIDFGYHWDEPGVIRYEVDRWMPHEYGYPSMTFTITRLATASHLAVMARRFRIEDPSTWRERLRRYSYDPREQHRMKLVARTACLLVSQLSVVGVFIIVAGAWGRPEAALACVLLSFSNEFLYHSRWAVPDTLHAFWGVMTMAAVLLALRRGSFRALCGAAALAGATVATKYTSMFIICPVFACCLMITPRDARRAARRCLLLAALAAGVFLLVCPGIIIEHEKFWRTVMPVFRDYTHGHGGYTVRPGLPHLGLSLLYLSTQFFSGIMAVNVAFFALAIWGAVSWIARRRREAALIFLYLVFYVGFISSFVTMIARNLMPVIPFLAIFAARGIASCRSALPPLPRGVFSLLVAAAVAATAAMEARDAVGIKRHAHDHDYPVRSALEHVGRDGARRYYVHENIREALLAQGPLPSNVTGDPDEADYVLAFAPYLPNNIENSPFVIRRWFGTREVNLRYYSIWQQDVWGMERDKPNPVILRPADARKYGLL